MAYTDEQLAFLNHDPGASCRVLAGPGTGKSYTSVAYLEKITSDQPDLRVGYITFTRAATAEFAKKMDDSGLTALGGRPPQTMHGFSLSILLRHHSSRLPYPLRIIDSWEEKYLINPDISRSLKTKSFATATPGLVAKLQSELAAGFQSLDQSTLPISAEQPQLMTAYRGVWAANRNLYGYSLLSELPFQAGGVLADLDESDLGLDLLIVDEYQDLNFADQRVLTQVANRDVAIVGIGDDDQSIYSWRKAAPVGIRNFLPSFDTIYDYPLSVSQRCGGKALQVASNLIELDSERPQKRRLTPSDRTPETDFRYLRFKSNTAEAEGIANIIGQRIASGVVPGDIIVLARSSIPAWRRELESSMAARGIPITVAGSIDDLMAEPALRRALSLARLVVDPEDSLAWRSILHLAPGVGPSLVTKVCDGSDAARFAARLMAAHSSDWTGISRCNAARELVKGTLEWLEQNRDLSASDVNGWANWLVELAGPDGLSETTRSIVDAVGAQLTDGYDLSAFLNDFEPTAKELLTGTADGVRIITMGMSKGLTVDTAIILGVDSNTIPAPRGQWDEELRLLYVAMTRATALTIVSYASRRNGETARLGTTSVQTQREQSPYMSNLAGAVLEDGQAYAAGQP